MNVKLPADPKAVKRVEKTIKKEAHADDKDHQRTLKELKQSEKSEAKARKAAHKADKNMKRMEEKELSTAKSLQKVAHMHEQARTNLHAAQREVQVRNKQVDRSTRDAKDQRARVNEAFKAKQIREGERVRKLASLASG